MNAFPLIYGFRQLVAGRGFFAGVEVNGRALLKFEDEQWWAYAVEPGGLCASGGTELEAFEAFKETFRKVLCDSATVTADFKGFKADLDQLASQVNATWDEEWSAARLAIRNKEVEPSGEIATLSRETKSVKCYVSVSLLRASTVTPNANCSPERLQTAA